MNMTMFASISILAVVFSETGNAQDQCQPAPIRTDALDNPSKHAWDVFMQVMHPAKSIAQSRGDPDCSKQIGAPGTTAVWETWRLARTEVFLEDGREPPEWNDTSLYVPYLGRTPDAMPSPHNPPVQSAFAAKSDAGPAFDPEPDQGVFAGRGGIGETHMNRSTYDFIRENCLWSFDGLSRYSKGVLAGKKPPISFPVDSVEVKAVWVRFTAEDVKNGLPGRYYTAKYKDGSYGLTSFHILTKAVPNWFWATFHHVDAPKNEFELPDQYGRPAVLQRTVWENYVLGGTQIDFISPTGKPIILSDHYIEFGFQRSSCITCHASAHGHPEPKRSPDGSLLRDGRGRIVSASEGPLQTTNVGIPDYAAFEINGRTFYQQTDFLWSIPFRAREERAPPPQRCIF